MDYSDLFIWLSFFSLEIVILSICYRFIYKRKTLVNWSIVDYLKTLIAYYFFMIKYTLCSSDKDRDMDEFLDKNMKLRYALGEQIVFGCILLLFLPGMVVLLIRHIQFPMISVIAYAAGISVLLDRLKESRINLIYLLNESHKFLFRYKKIRVQMKGRGKKEKIESKQVEKNTIKDRIRILIVALLITCGSFLFALTSRNFIIEVVLGSLNLEQLTRCFSLWGILFLLFLFAYLLYSGAVVKIKQRIRYLKYLKNKSDIEVWMEDENIGGLGNWLDEVLRMCGLLNIKEVRIGIDDTGVKKVFSFVSSVHMPIIIIGEEVFEKSIKLYPKEHFEIIRMLIAHELVHIHYKDEKWKKKVSATALFHMALLAYLLIIIAVNCNIFFGSIMVLMLFILDFAVFRIFRDERYWKQVMEFRADRVGMSISHTTPELLEKVLTCTTEDEEKENNNGKIDIFHKIYQRKIERQIHPSAERRIYEAKRNRPWGVGEYFRYLWIIFRNLLVGSGWSL